jgi:effector-binding domain-containing protein
MSLEQAGITHKRLDDMLVASLRFQMRDREELFAKLEDVRSECQGCIAGPPLAIFYWDTGLEGIDTEACFPVTSPVEAREINSRTLVGEEVFTRLHRGSHDTIEESYREIGARLVEHGVNPENRSREVFLEYLPNSPQDNVTEIQVSFVNWEQRLSDNLERVLGASARAEVLQDLDVISPGSSCQERKAWVNCVTGRLHARTTELERFDILSGCAHIFSPKRIERVRGVYERNLDVDEVLKAMAEDPEWYEKPSRDGDTIYVTKVPRNRNGYEEATNEAERKLHYCHCALVRRDPSDVHPDFCYCGSGWYRQIWEGILRKPVQVEILKSLTNGDDVCQFAIHLGFQTEEANRRSTQTEQSCEPGEH